MANQNLLQKKIGQNLWFALLGLGFQPESAAGSLAGKANTKYLCLGPNMFDKPNKDAFYLVTHFLLEKLNPSRFHEAYRHCWPVLDHKADAEFRKVTCTWLREIMVGSVVFLVMSLFLSPGGPKFINLMLQLACHVMLQDMKTFTTDKSWVPEAAAMPASTLDIAVGRLNFVRSRFLKAAVDQDRFLHEYQRRAQSLVKSMRDLKAEGHTVKMSLDCMKDAVVFSLSGKVRALWSVIEGMLSNIKEDLTVIESVLKGDVDQYVLDGTDRVLKLPPCLLERIEHLPHRLNSGNLYEAGQLNLLCVMELLNHALQALKEECFRISPSVKSQPGAQHLQEKCQQMCRVLQDLRLIRQKLSKEEIPEVKSAIRELQASWEQKWMHTLKEKPLVSFLNEDPALGFLSPMAPLSFEPAPEATYRRSIFAQFPAKLLGTIASKFIPGLALRHAAIPSWKGCSCSTASGEYCVNQGSSGSIGLYCICVYLQPPSVDKTTHHKTAPVKTHSEILDLEYENLADQFADAVTTTSPFDGQGKGSDLEDLLSTLQMDPFSTRKQLPRTPKSLIMDVKSSWRKAVDEDEAKRHSLQSESNDSISGRLSPVSRVLNLSPSLAENQTSPPTLGDQEASSACQQGLVPKSSLLWETFYTEAHDTPSGTGSSAVQFSLEHETLPEMPSCDSLYLEDEAVDMTSEEEELLIPSLKTDLKNAVSLIEGSPGGLLSDHRISAKDKTWLTEPTASEDDTNKVFSLDLDSLDSPQKKEYSLPTLITFSPIDDMKLDKY
uniref:HAUS augmin like complex subunit 6 n=1 Tax=Cyprinodon variegatus TaxID=28743 RepID=A0A3Q2GKX0_CYPVA